VKVLTGQSDLTLDKLIEKEDVERHAEKTFQPGSAAAHSANAESVIADVTYQPSQYQG
jgi:hypothetical protein